MINSACLFCIPEVKPTGGLQVLWEHIRRLTAKGIRADVLNFGIVPLDPSLGARMVEPEILQPYALAQYRFVIVTNAFLLPEVLPFAQDATPVLYCFDYEPFVFDAPDHAYNSLYRTPIPILTISRALQQILKARTGRDSYHVPVGIDHTVFYERPWNPPEGAKRIAMVGSYLLPVKDMKTGFRAMELLCREMALELVLITREKRHRQILKSLPFTIEIHDSPDDAEVPSILSTCHAFCCPSRYEGLGLPALEAMACGVPVVATRNCGVSDYGRHRENLLLAEPGDPEGLADSLRTVLTNSATAESLRQNGLIDAGRWCDRDHAFDVFWTALEKIEATFDRSSPVDPDEIRRIHLALIDEGVITPMPVLQGYRRLQLNLAELLTALRQVAMPAAGQIEQLRILKEQFGRMTKPESTAYSSAFREREAFCRLLLSFASDRRFEQILAALEQRK